MPKRKRKSKQKRISIKDVLDGWQQLVKAAKNGENDRIQALLDLGIDVNANERDGHTALHSACYEKQLETVKFLVERGANVQARTNFGDTPFLLAFYFSEEWECDLSLLPLELVQFLVDHGADVNDVGSYGDTAIHIACKEHGDDALRLVKFLVENGAKAVGVQDKAGDTAFEIACWTEGRWGNPALVQFLIDSGVDLTVKYDDTIALHTWTMHWACRHRFLDIVKMLKNQYGPADLNSFADSGKRPLHLACWSKSHKNKLKTAKYLIENGVKVNDATDNDGMTPLYSDSYQLNLETAEFLIAHTENLNSKDKYGRTALLYHCKHKSWDIGEALIENGADIHMNDNDGNTPLHFACKNGTPIKFSPCKNGGLDMVKLLLSRGANVNLTNKEGNTPLQLACQENCQDVVWFLLRQQPWLVTE